MVGLVYQFFICFMLLTFPFVPLFPSWMPSYALSVVNHLNLPSLLAVCNIFVWEHCISMCVNLL